MSATTAGAVKAWLESAGLGIAVYRRQAPDGSAYPFATVDGRVSLIPERHGDNGASAAVTETITVNVYQQVANESHTLADAVTQRLHGAHLPAGPTHVYGVTVDFATEVADPDPAVVHTAITCSVRRALQEA